MPSPDKRDKIFELLQNFIWINQITIVSIIDDFRFHSPVSQIINQNLMNNKIKG